MLGSAMSRFRSLVRTPSGKRTGRGRCVSTSTTQASSRRTPILAAMASPSSQISLATPVPTVPNPTNPTRTRFSSTGSPYLFDLETQINHSQLNDSSRQVKQKPPNPATDWGFRPESRASVPARHPGSCDSPIRYPDASLRSAGQRRGSPHENQSHTTIGHRIVAIRQEGGLPRGRRWAMLAVDC